MSARPGYVLLSHGSATVEVTAEQALLLSKIRDPKKYNERLAGYLRVAAIIQAAAAPPAKPLSAEERERLLDSVRQGPQSRIGRKLLWSGTYTYAREIVLFMFARDVEAQVAGFENEGGMVR